jgi:hypothetical protein
MKKTLSLFLAFALALCCFQNLIAQVRFGVKGGLNLATIAYSDDFVSLRENLFGSEMQTSMIPSFHFGGQAEFDLGEKLGLGLGLQLSGKGNKHEFEYELLDSAATFTSKSTPLYAQMPAYFYFRSGGFFISAGAYVGLGVAGRYEITTNSALGQEKEEGDIEFTDDYNPLEGDTPTFTNYSPLDFGLNAELGYEFGGKFRVSASYSFGLTNTFSKDYAEYLRENFDFNIEGSHRIIGVSVAYLFAGGAPNESTK